MLALAANHTVIAVDIPGFGSWGSALSADKVAVSALLHKLVAQLGQSPFTYSIGLQVFRQAMSLSDDRLSVWSEVGCLITPAFAHNLNSSTMYAPLLMR